ncbi:hypothetical protein TYRP_012353 [Tyrophagus putrescentiae]|nr:hypothetical protein TYRP_012353 [Tyrophagus putrescentiae]
MSLLPNLAAVREVLQARTTRTLYLRPETSSTSPQIPLLTKKGEILFVGRHEHSTSRCCLKKSSLPEVDTFFVKVSPLGHFAFAVFPADKMALLLHSSEEALYSMNSLLKVKWHSLPVEAVSSIKFYYRRERQVCFHFRGESIEARNLARNFSTTGQGRSLASSYKLQMKLLEEEGDRVRLLEVLRDFGFWDFGLSSGGLFKAGKGCKVHLREYFFQEREQAKLEAAAAEAKAKAKTKTKTKTETKVEEEKAKEEVTSSSGLNSSNTSAAWSSSGFEADVEDSTTSEEVLSQPQKLLSSSSSSSSEQKEGGLPLLIKPTVPPSFADLWNQSWDFPSTISDH